MTDDSIETSLKEIDSATQVDAKCIKLKRLFNVVSNDFLSYIGSKSLSINSDKNVLVDYVNKFSKIVYSFSYLDEIGILVANFIQTILPKYHGHLFIRVFLYRLFIITIAILYKDGNSKAISSLTNFIFIDSEYNTHTFSSLNVLYVSNQIVNELGDTQLDKFLESIVDSKYVKSEELFMADAILINYELYSPRLIKTDFHYHWLPLYRPTIESRDTLSHFFKSMVGVVNATQVAKIYGFKSVVDFKHKCHEIESMENMDRINQIGINFLKIESNLIYNFIKSQDIGKFES